MTHRELGEKAKIGTLVVTNDHSPTLKSGIIYRINEIKNDGSGKSGREIVLANEWTERTIVRGFQLRNWFEIAEEDEDHILHRSLC